MKSIVLSDRIAAFNTGALVIFVFIFAFRFILGLYEIPLTVVIEGFMSSNARMGFTGRFISNIGKSSRFVLVKMLYTVVFDIVILFSVYWLFELFNLSVVKYFAPFIIMLAVLILLTVRYTFIAMWAPDAVLRDKGVFRAFGYSVKKSVRNMGSIFTTFICAWTLIIAVNMLTGIFTFGAGLILTLPLSVLFINFLNMAVYYGKTGRRYYTDANTVVTPPIVSDSDGDRK